jgi:hypothetical protein
LSVASFGRRPEPEQQRDGAGSPVIPQMPVTVVPVVSDAALEAIGRNVYDVCVAAASQAMTDVFGTLTDDERLLDALARKAYRIVAAAARKALDDTLDLDSPEDGDRDTPAGPEVAGAEPRAE